MLHTQKFDLSSFITGIVCYDWGPWNECSATCGGGMKSRYRQCMNPDGAVITMDDIAQCNTKPCQKGKMHIVFSENDRIIMMSQLSLLIEWIAYNTPLQFTALLWKLFEM